jgi:hypothetical protein
MIKSFLRFFFITQKEFLPNRPGNDMVNKLPAPIFLIPQVKKNKERKRVKDDRQHSQKKGAVLYFLTFFPLFFSHTILGILIQFPNDENLNWGKVEYQ